MWSSIKSLCERLLLLSLTWDLKPNKSYPPKFFVYYDSNRNQTNTCSHLIIPTGVPTNPQTGSRRELFKSDCCWEDNRPEIWP